MNFLFHFPMNMPSIFSSGSGN